MHRSEKHLFIVIYVFLKKILKNHKNFQLSKYTCTKIHINKQLHAYPCVSLNVSAQCELNAREYQPRIHHNPIFTHSHAFTYVKCFMLSPIIYKKWKTHETPNSTVNHLRCCKTYWNWRENAKNGYRKLKRWRIFCSLILSNTFNKSMSTMYVVYSNAFRYREPGHIRIHLYYSQNANDNKINSNETNERTPPPNEWVFGANFPISPKNGSISFMCHTHYSCTPFHSIFHIHIPHKTRIYIFELSVRLCFFFSSSSVEWTLYVYSLYINIYVYIPYFSLFFRFLPKHRLSSGMRMLPFCRR